MYAYVCILCTSLHMLYINEMNDNNHTNEGKEKLELGFYKVPNTLSEVVWHYLNV